MAASNGALSSLLMTLPLIAVPCLAVFGLPSIGPATAEADADEAAVDLGPAIAPGGLQGSAPAFTPIVDAGPATAHAPRTEMEPTFDRRGGAPNMPLDLDLPDGPPSAPPAAATGFGAQELTGAPPAQTAAAPPTAPPAPPAGRTLDAAIARLNAVGILDIRFARGETPGQVHFSCSYNEAASVTRRFEGEGADSLAAVEDVLRQVEAYFAAARGPATAVR